MAKLLENCEFTITHFHKGRSSDTLIQFLKIELTNPPTSLVTARNVAIVA
jgi:hypothetical protein